MVFRKEINVGIAIAADEKVRRVQKDTGINVLRCISYHKINDSSPFV